jgi:hypothetical protein
MVTCFAVKQNIIVFDKILQHEIVLLQQLLLLLQQLLQQQLKWLLLEQ